MESSTKFFFFFFLLVEQLLCQYNSLLQVTAKLNNLSRTCDDVVAKVQDFREVTKLLRILTSSTKVNFNFYLPCLSPTPFFFCCALSLLSFYPKFLYKMFEAELAINPCVNTSVIVDLDDSLADSFESWGSIRLGGRKNTFCFEFVFFKKNIKQLCRSSSGARTKSNCFPELVT